MNVLSYLNRRFLPLSILLIGIVSSFNVFSQSLSGTYTIGGSSPDYPTFTAAVSALNTNGINGNVTFNVRPGEYIENIKINQILGSSSSAKILFQSESGIAEDVVLKHMHLSWANHSNYTLYLDGTDYISFKNLSFQALLNRDYNRVLYVAVGSDHVSFESNRFISWYESSGAFNENDAITILDSRYLNFIDNYIEGGNTGLFVGGSYTTNDWLIEGNTFNKQYSTGLKISRGTKVKVLSNTIESQDGFESYFMNGMEISQVRDSITIDGNNIYLKQGGRGIYISSCSSTGRKAFTLSNNMIAIGVTSVSGAHRRGIYSNRNDTISLFYNSINIEGPGNSGEIIYSIGNDTLLAYNNMFTHTGGGKIYYSTSSANTVLISDYNNLYNSNQSIAELSGTTYSNMNSLRNGRNIENSSFALNPIYLRPNYLVPSNSSVYERGTPITEVTKDYFGNQRSLTQTDVGVFEGRVPDVDVGINTVSLSNYVSCPGDTFPVYASLKNFGFFNLTSADIFLEINDSVYQTNWSGNLGRYGSSGTIFLGNVSAPVNKLESWKVYTSQPNGIQDSLSVNDTLSGKLLKAMKGHFTVGSSSLADFTSLEKAFETLLQRGICDSTFLDVEAGTYDEQIIVPDIAGTSANSPLIIQSLNRDSSSVLYRFYGTAARNYIFKLEDTKHTIIRNLSMWNRSSSYNVVIQLEGNGESISIENNFIRGQGAVAFGNRSLINMDFGFRTTVPKNITVKNNRFSKGGYQIYIDGYNTNRNQNILIENNIFNQSNISIYAEYFDGLTIRGNQFSGYRSTCVELKQSNGAIKIEKNKINVESNYSVSAIKLSNCTGSSSAPIEISNNFITVDATNANGVRLTHVSHLNLYHNNFHIVTGDGFMLSFDGTIVDLDSKNNIFYASQTGRAYFTNLILTPAILSSDYNCFYTNNPNLHEIRSSGMSLQAWQLITTHDQNSVVYNPFFVNDSNLHVTNHVPLDGTGIGLSSITDDIDGELRGSVPDIGADEFDIDSSNYYDLELESFTRHGLGICQKSDSIFIQVVNHSNFTMDSFYTKWGLLGRALDSVKQFISILPKDTVEVYIGSFNFRTNTFYKFDIQVLWPNGNRDNIQQDNRKVLEYNKIDFVKIKAKPSSYCSGDTELFIEKYPNQSILWSTGGFENAIQVSGSGSYTVTVTDNYGCVHTDTISIP